MALLGAASAEWIQVWNDEFDGGNLADRWNFETGCGGWGNNELQCYTNNRNENARQENGNLVITARREWWGDGVNPDKEFTSSRMTSKANWLHGKFDIRARLPKGKHLWPAIWMMPQNSEYGGWPRSGEMDIMEYRGQRPQQILGTLHFGPEWNNKGDAGTGERNYNIDFSQDFHVFTFDWSPMKVQWILDGNVYHEESLERNFWPGFYNGNGQPFDKAFFLILNLAVGGNFFGSEPFIPDDSNFWDKNTLEVDYVRAFRWQ